ncbi:hypothetical protein KSP39_PZI022388 [Platanthera zijinensis]|uniref:Ribosomal protein L23 n=1 Tax=Platanthera zijinensis TaxID=2320716 RepID=A0AAP0FVL8_9ASPA
MHWIELFFCVKVISIHSHRLPGKGRRMGPLMGHTMHYRRMIMTLQPGSYIPPLLEKRTGSKSNERKTFLKNFYPEHTQWSRSVDSQLQVKSNPTASLWERS